MISVIKSVMEVLRGSGGCWCSCEVTLDRLGVEFICGSGIWELAVAHRRMFCCRAAVQVLRHNVRQASGVQIPPWPPSWPFNLFDGIYGKVHEHLKSWYYTLPGKCNKQSVLFPPPVRGTSV